MDGPDIGNLAEYCPEMPVSHGVSRRSDWVVETIARTRVSQTSRYHSSAFPAQEADRSRHRHDSERSRLTHQSNRYGSFLFECSLFLRRIQKAHRPNPPTIRPPNQGAEKATRNCRITRIYSYCTSASSSGLPNLNFK